VSCGKAVILAVWSEDDWLIKYCGGSIVEEQDSYRVAGARVVFSVSITGRAQRRRYIICLVFHPLILSLIRMQQELSTQLSM
jgi:hypothetical protein